MSASALRTSIRTQDHDDRRRGDPGEVVLWPPRPVVDLDRQDRVGPGERVRQERHEREGSDEDQRSRLADGSGHRQDDPGHDPRRCGRQDRAADHLPAGRTQGIGALALGVRDGLQRLDRGDDDHRQDEEGQREPGGEDRRSELHQPDEDGQPQDPVDDRWNAGEVADVRLERAVHPAVGRVLVEVDGRRDPHREGDDADDDPDHQRADQGGQDAGVRWSSRRATGDELPVEPGQAACEDIDQQHDQGEEQDPDRHDAQPVEDRAAELAAHERRFEPDGRVHRRGRRHRHQYSVRNLRTTQPLSRLRTSVNTNSVAATAKSDFELDRTPALSRRWRSAR